MITNPFIELSSVCAEKTTFGCIKPGNFFSFVFDIEHGLDLVYLRLPNVVVGYGNNIARVSDGLGYEYLDNDSEVINFHGTINLKEEGAQN